MKIKKQWIAATSVACVMGASLVSYAQQPLTLPGRQPVRLSSQIEIEEVDEVAEIKLTSKSTTARTTNFSQTIAREELIAPQAPRGIGFPQRRTLLDKAPALASKASERFAELLDRTAPEEEHIAHNQNDIPPTPPEEPTPGFHGESDPLQFGGHSSQPQIVAPTPPVEAYAPAYVPANSDCDVLPWMSPYDDRARVAPQFENLQLPDEAMSALPTNYQPWWSSELSRRIRDSEHLLPVNVDMLTIGALQHAPQVLALKTEPDIRYTYLWEEQANFDWTAFVETKWQDINEPVGSTLTTNSSRFKNDIWSGKAGLRQKNLYGGEFEISQRLGYEHQNSPFFIPPEQGTGRLSLSYTQPLLNGHGEAYNRSRMVLAQVDANKSFDEVAQDLQDHLLKVSEAYWELYRARSTFLQRYKVLVAGEEILGTLGGRQEVDALQRQVLRAKAAVAGRRTDIVRAAAAIRNAESRLRLLVNDPRLLEVGRIELIPGETPQTDYVPVSMTGSLQKALMFRPEISQAIRDLRANGVRLGMAEHELLPKLDLVLEAYTKGLAGDGDVASGYGKQWSEGRPSYTIGLEFEMPLGNRAANSRLIRRQNELNKAVYEFRTIVETGLTDVELAVRDVETSYREMLSQYQAMQAAETEAYYLEDRWKFLPGGDRSTTLLLEDLLDAQERLVNTEADFVDAQVSYSIALMRVRRETGTLLQTQSQMAIAPLIESSPVEQDLPSSSTPMLAPPEYQQSEETIPPAPSF